MQGTGLLGIPAEPPSWVRMYLAESRLEGRTGAEEELTAHHHGGRPDPAFTIGQQPQRKDTMVGMNRPRVGLGAKKNARRGL